MDSAPNEDLDPWTPSSEEYELSTAKIGANRLDFALLLKCFQIVGRFPSATSAIEAEVIAYVAQQLSVDSGTIGTLGGRTLERARAEIRNFCGFREATVDDAEQLTECLSSHVAATSLRGHESLIAALEAECRKRLIEPPAPERVDRIVRSTIRAHEERFCNTTVARLSPVNRARLDALLHPPSDVAADAVGEDVGDTAEVTLAATTSVRAAVINQLRSNAGRPSVNSLRNEMAKLEILRQLELPRDLLTVSLRTNSSSTASGWPLRNRTS